MEKLGARQGNGNLLGGVLLALLVGALSPYLLAFLPLFLAPVLLMWVFARSGLAAAMMGIAAALASTGVVLGPRAALWTMVAFYPPFLVALAGVRQKKPFAEQVKRSVAAGILSLALAVLLARLMAGGDLVSQLMAALESALNGLPVEMLDSLFTAGAASGLLPIAPANAVAGSISIAQRQEMVAELIQALGSLYEQSLPGLLLFGAALTGLLLAAIPNRALCKRGLVPRECYSPLGKWHLPASATFGLLAVFAGILIVNSTGMPGASAVSFAGEALLNLAFGIQAVGSLERRLIAGNLRPGTRVLLIVLFVAMLSPGRFLMFYGMFSALMGPHYGAIPKLLSARKDDEDSNS